MTFNITAVIPVLNRPKNVKTCITSFLDTVPNGRGEILFITGNDCQDEINEINKYSDPISIVIAPDNIVSWSKRINFGINYSKTKHSFNEPSPWILCGADDILFHNGWFDIAEESSKDFIGIIGTNDLGNHACILGAHSTHPIVSREYVENFGTIDEKGKLCHEGYLHNFVDVELISTAKQRNAWKGVTTCIIEHLHPAWKKGVWDDVYEKGQSNLGHDRQLWINRSQKYGLKQ